MSLEPGMQVGDYQLLEVLGAGGMGKVYKVRNIISDRIEAMKVLLPDLSGDPGLADRFLREIKVQASLEHPNIAGLRTAMRHGNQLLMVIEYVEGRTVDAYMHQGPIPVQNSVWVCGHVLEALEYAHSRGIVHRDIKPSNIMITNQGAVKLMDFGIARVMSDPNLTATQQTTGSLYYMSPEQINGLPVDGRSDLYSLGITLYQMVTGKRPFDAANTFGIMAAHLNQPPVPPVEHDQSIPPALSQVILTALAKDPSQRYQSAAEFNASLQRALEQVQQSSAPIQSSNAVPGNAANYAGSPPPQGVVLKPGISTRTIYMFAGSLATVGILVIAAIQGPRFFRTNAQENVPTIEQPADPGKPQVQTPPVQNGSLEAVAGQAQQPAAPAQDGTRTSPGSERARTQPQVLAQNRPPADPVTPAESRTQGQTPAVSSPADSPQGPVSVAPSTPTTAATQPSTPQISQADRAALAEYGKRLMQMGIRYAAAQSAYKSLEESQARQGLRPRGDLGTLLQRVSYQMDQAENAVKQTQPAEAKEHLDTAERALEQLEKFFNL